MSSLEKAFLEESLKVVFGTIQKRDFVNFQK